MTLEPTPDLLAAARRAAGTGWIVGPRGSAEACTDPALALLVQAGYVRIHYVSAADQMRGRDDYWSLTTDGRAWLADQDRAVS